MYRIVKLAGYYIVEQKIKNRWRNLKSFKNYQKVFDYVQELKLNKRESIC
jgi:hypothetical protein